MIDVQVLEKRRNKHNKTLPSQIMVQSYLIDGTVVGILTQYLANIVQ